MNKKKILIIDERSFSRVCSAILEHEGYETHVHHGARTIDSLGTQASDYGLVVTSYPQGYDRLREIRFWGIPTIVLSDQINRDVIQILECNEKTYCMIKPVDYRTFKTLVRQIMSGEPELIQRSEGGVTIG